MPLPLSQEHTFRGSAPRHRRLGGGRTFLHLGPFTNDVSREGEGGGWPISDERKGGCVDLVLTRGREGVQNPENLADVIYVWPKTGVATAGTETRIVVRRRARMPEMPQRFCIPDAPRKDETWRNATTYSPGKSELHQREKVMSCFHG